MSKVHVLEADALQYRVVLHTAVPTGNNSALKSWKDCVVQAGLNTTILSVGTGPSQITQAEADDIAAGDIIEFVTQIPVESGGGTTASLNDMATIAITAAKDALQARLKYFGHAQG